MLKDEYSPFKMVHHQGHLADMKKDMQVVPLQVQLIPSNACNQRCVFCTYRMKDYACNQMFDEKVMLPHEKVLECIDDFADMGVKAVQFTGGGEPLTHPNIREQFEYTLSKDLQLSLVSNGMALTDVLCRILSQASWSRISMDSATPKTYAQERSVSPKVFHRTVLNIEKLVHYNQGAVLGIGFVVTKGNYKEIYQAAKLAKELGVNNFRISGAFTNDGYSYFDGFREEAWEQARKATELTDRHFTVFNLFNERMNDLFEGKQEYMFCPMKELLTYVGADFNVYTCCTLAYNTKGLIGSIKEQSFRELWEGPKKRKMFRNHNPRKLCQQQCLYRGKNEFINYCLNHNPSHIDYI